MWKISYYNEAVEEGVLGLPDKVLARYIRLTETMIEYGPNLGMPHTKALSNGLFELRLKGKEGIARVFYCTVVKMEIFRVPLPRESFRPSWSETYSHNAALSLPWTSPSPTLHDLTA
jgi:hypothetical protein